ncbi:MAG: hypothetical protein M3N47_00630 [Chloroflexota bacterium]|nr:hypothetical protein [Chloroflexota bacterium]
MTLVCLTVPDRHRDALLEELRKIIDPQEVEIVEQTGDPGDVGLRFDDSIGAISAVERTNALRKEAGNVAGKYEVGVSAEEWRPPSAG